MPAEVDLWDKQILLVLVGIHTIAGQSLEDSANVLVVFLNGFLPRVTRVTTSNDDIIEIGAAQSPTPLRT